MNSMIHNESRLTVALAQTKEKLYHNANAFLYLILLHLIGYLIASGTGMTYGSGGEFFMLTYRQFSSTPLYLLTIFWMLFQGYSLAEEKSRQYYMVSNNFTAYFSDIAVLEVYALIGGVLTLFSGFLQQVIASLFFENFLPHSLFDSIGLVNYLGLWITGTVYFLIFGTVGYLVGVLRTRYRSLFVLGVLFGAILLILISLITAYSVQGSAVLDITVLFRFYLDESRFFIWLIKVVTTIAALYGLSYLGLKNMEVNR